MSIRNRVVTWIIKGIRYLRIAEIYAVKGTWIFTDVEDDGSKTNRRVYDNLVTTVGKVAVARRLGGAGVKANEGEITYIAVGTDGTAATIGDTTLGTETARKTTTYGGLTGTQVSIRVYFTKSEAVATLLEAAGFGEDASGAADSGTMYNRVIINVAKTNQKGLQVELLVTVA